MPSLTVDKLYGGITEDDKLGLEGTYIYSENLNIGNGSYVNLANGPTNKLNITTGGDDPHGIYEVNGQMIVFCEDGKIYKNSLSTAVYTHSGAKDIVAMWSNVNDLIFVTYNGTGNPLQYHKINLTDITNNDWSTYVTENFLSISVNPTTDFIAIKSVGQNCFLGVGNKIVKINLNPTTNTYSYSVFSFTNKTVKGITYSGAIFKVFQEDGIMYVWDGVNENYSEIINLDVPIRNVLSLANIDYVVGGYSSFYTEFFYLNGYTLTPIFKKSYSEKLNTDKNNIFSNGALQNYLTYKTGSIYFPGLYGSKRVVVKYGAEINGLNKGLSIISTKSSFGYDYSTIFGVYGRDVGLYILFKDSNGNIGVDFINTSEANNTVQKSGHLITKVYDLGNAVTEKQFKELIVRTNNVSSLIKIVVKYSINSSSYYTLGTITESGEFSLSMDDLDLQNFKDISFRFEFDGTQYPSTITQNPQLYGFTLEYDFNE